MHGVSFAGSLDLLDAKAVVSRLAGYVEKQLVEWAEGLPAKLDGVRKGHPVKGQKTWVCPRGAWLAATTAWKWLQAFPDTSVTILARYRAQVKLVDSAVRHLFAGKQYQKQVDVATSLGVQSRTCHTVVLRVPVQKELFTQWHLDLCC